MKEECPFCGGPMPVESEFKTKKSFEEWNDICQKMSRCSSCMDRFIDGGDSDSLEIDEDEK